MPNNEKSEPANEMEETEIRIDETSLKWIFFKYFPRLIYYADKFLNDEEKARDAVTDAFVDIWKSRAKLYFKNEKLLQGFLYKVTKNKAVDDVRMEKKDRELVKILTSLEGAMAFDEGVDLYLVETEAIAYYHMLSELKKLSPKYQKSLLLSINGRSNREIAKIMKISESSVRSNLARAADNIRKGLKEHGIFHWWQIKH
ncbi:MAG: RNA polymerase sigma factor [Puia sp.]|nr:RNA polymerase sigma factor [Puia sp.]